MTPEEWRNKFEEWSDFIARERIDVALKAWPLIRDHTDLADCFAGYALRIIEEAQMAPQDVVEGELREKVR